MTREEKNIYFRQMGGIKMLKGLQHNDIVKIITDIDVYIGFLVNIDKENKLIWISQAGSLVDPIFFNFREILKIDKIR